jgi:hypothetical protein
MLGTDPGLSVSAPSAFYRRALYFTDESWFLKWNEQVLSSSNLDLVYWISF